MNWKRLLKGAGIVIGLGVVAYAAACAWVFYSLTIPVDTEVARFANTSRTMDAVIVNRGRMAAASNSVAVYVVSALAKPEGIPLTDWDNAEGVSVTWLGDETLLIAADNARIFSDKDFSQQDEVIIESMPHKALRVRYAIKNIDRRGSDYLRSFERDAESN